MEQASEIQLPQLQRNVIDNAAQHLLDRLQIDKNKAVDVYDLAKELGFQINWISGSTPRGAIVLSPGIGDRSPIKVLGVNPNLPVEQNREVIARELARYYLLSRQGRRPYRYIEYENNDTTSDVDPLIEYFASSILLPKDQILSQVKRGKRSSMPLESVIDSIAQKYGTTTKVTSKRLKYLGVA